MTLPYEIYRNIWIYFPYNTIKQLGDHTPLFCELCHDDYMWYQKTFIDFYLAKSTYDILVRKLSGYDGYLKIAALHGIPITKAYNYYEYNCLFDNLAKCDHIEPELFMEYAKLAVRPMCDIIEKLSPEQQINVSDELTTLYPRYAIDINRELISTVAARGDLQLFEKLLGRFYKFNVSDFFPAALSSGNMELIQWIIAQEPPDYSTLLDCFTYAVKSNDISIVKWTLALISESDQEISSVDIFDAAYTAAIESGNIEIVELFINVRNYNLDSILYSAACSRQVNIMKYLFAKDHQFDVTNILKSLGQCGDIDLIEWYINNNDIDKDVVIKKICRQAAIYGHTQVLQYNNFSPRN